MNVLKNIYWWICIIICSILSIPGFIVVFIFLAIARGIPNAIKEIINDIIIIKTCL